jgi:hypothetical protein
MGARLPRWTRATVHTGPHAHPQADVDGRPQHLVIHVEQALDVDGTDLSTEVASRLADWVNAGMPAPRRRAAEGRS